MATTNGGFDNIGRSKNVPDKESSSRIANLLDSAYGKPTEATNKSSTQVLNEAANKLANKSLYNDTVKNDNKIQDDNLIACAGNGNGILGFFKRNKSKGANNSSICRDVATADSATQGKCASYCARGNNVIGQRYAANAQAGGDVNANVQTQQNDQVSILNLANNTTLEDYGSKGQRFTEKNADGSIKNIVEVTKDSNQTVYENFVQGENAGALRAKFVDGTSFERVARPEGGKEERYFKADGSKQSREWFDGQNNSLAKESYDNAGKITQTFPNGSIREINADSIPEPNAPNAKGVTPPPPDAEPDGKKVTPPPPDAEPDGKKATPPPPEAGPVAPLPEVKKPTPAPPPVEPDGTRVKSAPMATDGVISPPVPNEVPAPTPAGAMDNSRAKAVPLPPAAGATENSGVKSAPLPPPAGSTDNSELPPPVTQADLPAPTIKGSDSNDLDKRVEHFKGQLEQKGILPTLETTDSLTDADIDTIVKLSQTADEKNHIKQIFLKGDISAVTPAGMAKLSELKDLQWLGLSHPSVSDKTLEALSAVNLPPNMKTLMISKQGSSNLTDKGFAQLGKLTQLENLSVLNLDLTDKGVEGLKGLSNLKELYLSGTKITDASVSLIRGQFGNLSDLDVSSTKISSLGEQQLPEGISSLRRFNGRTIVRNKPSEKAPPSVPVTGKRAEEKPIVKTEPTPPPVGNTENSAPKPTEPAPPKPKADIPPPTIPPAAGAVAEQPVPPPPLPDARLMHPPEIFRLSEGNDKPVMASEVPKVADLSKLGNPKASAAERQNTLKAMVENGKLSINNALIDEDLEAMAALSVADVNIEEVSIAATSDMSKVTERGIKQLASLIDLKRLSIESTSLNENPKLYIAGLKLRLEAQNNLPK